MKRYGICLLLILALAAACIAAGYFATRTKAEPESAISNTTYETESVKENRVVINQKQVEPIAETGLEQFYLVFCWCFLKISQPSVCIPIFRLLTFQKRNRTGFGRESGFHL